MPLIVLPPVGSQLSRITGALPRRSCAGQKGGAQQGNAEKEKKRTERDAEEKEDTGHEKGRKNEQTRVSGRVGREVAAESGIRI